METKRLIIEGLSLDDGNYEDAIREVADLIEQGYTNGIIGWSGASWHLESESEE